jgi:nucleoid-associated protein YgaU
MKHALIIVASSVLLLYGCGQQPEPVPTPAPSPQPPVVEPTPTAVPATPTPSSPISYTIREGDNLHLLALEFLGDSDRWPEIVAANPGMDPDLLVVGQEILIPRD